MFIKAAVIDFFGGGPLGVSGTSCKHNIDILACYWKNILFIHLPFLVLIHPSLLKSVIYQIFYVIYIFCLCTPVQQMCKVTPLFCFLIIPEGYISPSLSFEAKHSTMFTHWLPDRLSAIRSLAKNVK